jgi:hypothetical protein
MRRRKVPPARSGTGRAEMAAELFLGTAHYFAISMKRGRFPRKRNMAEADLWSFSAFPARSAMS